MNLIVIVLDSLRQDHVSAYHQGQKPFSDVPPCQTPHLDAFGRESLMFTNAYPEGLPTIPARYVLMTGQRSLPFRPWAPLRPGDLSIAQILRNEEFVCGLISDCYHYRAPGMNYHSGFHAYRWIRGQEYDPWESAPSARPLERYVNRNYTEEWRQRVAQFLANTEGFHGEEDWFAALVMADAIAWLKKNRVHKKVFLWLDCFDPHEPWDPPAQFDTYTDPAYSGPRLILPMGGPSASWATLEETRQMRGLYAGEVTFVDACFGRLVAALGELGYLDDSIILVMADHGHPLSDHGKFLKGADRLYNEMLRVPFMIRMPDQRYGGQRSDALIQFQDVLPTLLDLLELSTAVDAMHGKSFRDVLERRTDEQRQAVIIGYHEGIDRCIRTKTWSYIERPVGEQDELYNLIEDSHERRNLIEVYPEEAARLASRFGRYFRARRRRARGIQGKYELASSGLNEPALVSD